MTLDKLLALASGYLDLKGSHDHHVRSCDCRTCRIVDAVIDLLGEAAPCGFEPPCVEHHGRDPGPGIVAILGGDGDPTYRFTPSEARAYAAMLLRAADEAEGKR